jgi:DNA-binding MurR/RpiR family transcriptional regulator
MKDLLQGDDLMERLRQSADRLGEGARSVAELILSRPETVAMSPAARIAEQLQISESTVVRFATALGYSGYPALRRELQDHVSSRLMPAQRLDRYAKRHGPLSALEQSFRDDREDVAATERDVSPVTAAEAVRLLSSARQIYVLGLRSSFALSYTLFYNLRQTLGNTSLLDPSYGAGLDQLIELGPQDVLVAISFPRYTRLTLDAAAAAKRQGCRLIVITDGPLSPLAKHADVFLTARCSSKAFANSNVGALALINALVAEVVVSNRRRAVKSLRRLEKLLRVGDTLLFEEDKAGRTASEAKPTGRPRRKRRML